MKTMQNRRTPARTHLLSILFSGLLVTGLATVPSEPAHADPQSVTRACPVGICWTPGLIPWLPSKKKKQQTWV